MVIHRKLTEREETARLNLKRIFELEKGRRGLTQRDVNRAIGWTSSVFGQFIQGRLALSPRAIVRLAEFFKCHPADIDPELLEEFGAVNKNRSAPTDDELVMAINAVFNYIPHTQLAKAMELNLNAWQQQANGNNSSQIAAQNLSRTHMQSLVSELNSYNRNGLASAIQGSR